MDADTLLRELQAIVDTKTRITNIKESLANELANLNDNTATFLADFQAWLEQEQARIKKGAAPDHKANGAIIAALAAAFKDIFPLLMELLTTFIPKV